MTPSVIILLSTLCATALAGYAGSSSGNVVGGNGVSGGYGYGYGGDIPPGFPQQFFQHIPFDFNNLLAGYLDSFKNNQHINRAIAYTSVSIDPPFRGKVFARSRITFDGLNQIQKQVQNGAGAYGFPGGFPGYQGGNSGGGGYAGSFSSHGSGGGQGNFGYSTQNSGGYAPQGGGGGYGQPGGGYGQQGGGGGYGHQGVGIDQKSGGGGYFPSPGAYAPAGGYQAGASAHVGGGQVAQSAFLNPENPNNPNVNVRFASAPQGGGQFGSVFTSSSSGSRNVNGKPVHFRHAETTINDNGNVRTYSVHDRK